MCKAEPWSSWDVAARGARGARCSVPSARECCTRCSTAAPASVTAVAAVPVPAMRVATVSVTAVSVAAKAVALSRLGALSAPEVALLLGGRLPPPLVRVACTRGTCTSSASCVVLMCPLASSMRAEGAKLGTKLFSECAGVSATGGALSTPKP